MIKFEEIEPYLKDERICVVASCENNQPWAATVFYAYDNDVNIYFLSGLHRRHSKEILNNNRVAVAIAEHRYELGDKVKGIQVEGTCVPLSGVEAAEAFKCFKARFPQVDKLLHINLLTDEVSSFPTGTAVHRIWKLTPTRVKVFDEEKYGSKGKEYQVS